MRDILIGTTDYTVLVKIAGTDGAPETGLTEASIDLAYSRVETDNDVTCTDVTPAALSALTDAHTDWGFEEVDATNAPGLYRLDIADAVFASGAWEAVVTITDASGTDFYAVDIGFRLVAFNSLDAVRLGLTALPNANADAPGGLPISDAGGLDLDAILVDTGTDIPAAIAGIGTAGGAAINVDATTDNAAGGIIGVTSGTTKVGTETGTFANTSFVNGSYHLITHAANAIDWVYQFLTGGGTNVVSATWTGYLEGANDTITFYAWNHVGGAWESIGTQAGQAGSTNVVKLLTLYSRHRGTSTAELGKVYIRVACTGMTSPVLRTDALSVSYAVTSRSVGYANGEVWIDAVAGTAGTESFVNGVADNPVLTLADAITIATANKLTNFNIANGNTITLASTTNNKRFEGHEWILALGGQNISGTNFEGASAVTGTSSGTTDVHFEDCVIGNGSSGSTLPPGTYVRCGFNTGSGFAFTGSAAGRYVFADCYSVIAAGGATTPYFTFTGASTVMFRRYSGGANITFDASTAALTYECLGGGGLTVALAGADAQIRGVVRDITLTGITSATLVEFVGVVGNISLAGADGTVTLDGVVGAVVDSRTGSPTLNKPVNTMGIVGDITGTLATLTTYTGNTPQTADSNTLLTQIAADLPSRITKNVALANFMFLMVDETDLKTPETGLTVTATRSLDGAAFASCANAASEVASGFYKIDLADTDLNANVVTLRFTASGAATRTITIVTQP